MRALLKTGKWVEIDTSYLFENQYNTTVEYGNKRIFDGDIQKIEGDVRLGLGVCKYCGAMIKKGEEEKHFSERESKSCDKCFWYRDKLISSETPIKEKEEVVIDLPNGTQKKTVRTTKTEVRVYEKVCEYKNDCTKTDCTNKECRAYGIKWFTPDNCYFLKYPNGTDDYIFHDWIKGSWNLHGFRSYIYGQSLGSYSLTLHLKADEKTIDYLSLSNARRHISFTYEPKTGMYIVRDGIHHSPRMAKTLLEEEGRYPKCNVGINRMVKRIIEDVYKAEERVEQKGA